MSSICWDESTLLQIKRFNSVIKDANTAVQSQKAVTVYFSIEQLLPYGFTRQNKSTL